MGLNGWWSRTKCSPVDYSIYGIDPRRDVMNQYLSTDGQYQAMSRPRWTATKSMSGVLLPLTAVGLMINRPARFVPLTVYSAVEAEVRCPSNLKHSQDKELLYLRYSVRHGYLAAPPRQFVRCASTSYYRQSFAENGIQSVL
jgi:hypothetical protein